VDVCSLNKEHGKKICWVFFFFCKVNVLSIKQLLLYSGVEINLILTFKILIIKYEGYEEDWN